MWNNENLRPATFVDVELMPPTSLPESYFDVIISSSVLSHLTEVAMNAWLKEIDRILDNRGAAFLSFNGSGNSYLYSASHPPAVQELDGYGFFDEWRTPDLDGIVEGAEEYYRLTCMSDDRARTIFERHNILEDFVAGVTSMHQDIAVLRKNRRA